MCPGFDEHLFDDLFNSLVTDHILGGRNREINAIDVEVVEVVEGVDIGGGFLGESFDVLEVLRVFLVDKFGEVTSIIEDYVQGLAVGE